VNVLFIGGSDLTIHPNHRANHFIRFLQRHADKVDIVSATRFYSGERPAGVGTRLRHGLHMTITRGFSSVETPHGNVISLRKLPGRLDPLAQDLWAYLRLHRHLTGRRYQLCIFGNPDNALLPFLLRARGIVDKVIYDDWDYYPGFDESALWKRAMALRERLCLSISDVVISVGGLLSELRQRQGASCAIVIPNGVEYLHFAEAQPKQPHDPTLIYVGKLASEYGIAESIEGFAEVARQIPTARYLIIGYSVGGYSQRLIDLVQRLNLVEKVRFLGQRPYRDLPRYLAQADIGVALFKPIDLMRYAFPLKVVEYMASGLAVVGSDVGETGRLICEGGSGLAVDCSPRAFATAVLALLTNPAGLRRHQARAIEHARRYDWDQLFSRLLDVVDFMVPDRA